MGLRANREGMGSLKRAIPMESCRGNSNMRFQKPDDAIRRHRLVLATGATSFLCFILSALYLYWFPLIGSPIESDLLFLAVVGVWIGCLLAGSLAARRVGEVAVLLLSMCSLALLARIGLSVRSGVPFLHDPYFFGVATQNIILTKSLSPLLGWWYPQVDIALHWPVMNLLSIQLIDVSGLTLTGLMLFQEPFIGALTPVAIFLLARASAKRSDIALVAALVGASADLLIYYQTEYHPQGLALLLFVFFLYTYLRSRSAASIGMRVAPLAFVPALVLVHDFSSVLISIMAVAFIIFSRLGRFLFNRTRLALKTQPDTSRDTTMWSLIVVCVLAYNVLVFFGALGGFIRLLAEAQPPSSFIAVGGGVPILVTVLNAAKWGVLAFAMLGIAASLRHPDPDLFRLMVLLVLLLIAGVLADFVVGGPTERLVVFYLPIASVFAATGAVSLVRRGTRNAPRTTKVLVAFALGAICMAGFLNTPFPSLHFHTIGHEPYYSSSNDLSSAAYFQPTGNWIRDHCGNCSMYLTEFDTVMIPFYYGGVPIYYVHAVSADSNTVGPFLTSGMLVTNPSIPYHYRGVLFNKIGFLADSDVLYDNGVLVACTHEDA